MSSWTTITSLGDVKATMPVAALIGIGLARGNAWRMTIWWCVMFLGALTLVLVSKVAFIGWCVGSASLDFTGFSGHAMRATAIAPVVFFLLLQNASYQMRASGVLAGIAFGVLVGVSRIVLHDHSPSEVIAGCLLGLMVSLGFIFIFSYSTKFALSRLLFALCVLVILAMPFSEPAPTQGFIVDIAAFLSGHREPCTRGDWKTAASGRVKEAVPSRHIAN